MTDVLCPFSTVYENKKLNDKQDKSIQEESIHLKGQTEGGGNLHITRTEQNRMTRTRILKTEREEKKNKQVFCSKDIAF